jgi:hypothetical protein
MRRCRTSGRLTISYKGSNVPLLAQRFAAAVQALIADGPIKQRLTSACAEHLADIAEADLPPALREEFAGLQAAVSRVEPVGIESRVRASVQKMSASEAVGHAATIVKLYAELLAGLDRAEPLKVVGPPRKAPRYLAGGS